MIDCGNTVEEIEKALILALSDEFHQNITQVDNPYAREGTADTIMETICNALESGIKIKKTFYDILCE